MSDQEDFNIQEYTDNLYSEEYRKKQVEKLAENYRLLKSIEMENRGILTSFTDHDRNDKLLGVVNDVWSGVLDSDTEKHTVEDIVNMSLCSDENIKFLNDYKNKGYFPSNKVFEAHVDHPVQKKLSKKKYLSKREAKKQKTPMQTINYVYNAKNNSDRDERLLKVERDLADVHHQVSLLAVNQRTMGLAVDKNSKKLTEVSNRLKSVESSIKDSRKLKLYAIYTSEKQMTIQEMADEVGISLRTAKYWIKELKELEII